MQEQSSRILALDVGDRRIGMALSDEMRVTAQPFGTLTLQGEHDLKKIFSELFQILRQNAVSVIVTGLPINMNGTEGPQAEKVRRFVETFQHFLKNQKANPDQWEWIFWDERLSTSGAERHLIEADLSRAKRKKVIDKMAAVFILQGYLEQKQ